MARVQSCADGTLSGSRHGQGVTLVARLNNLGVCYLLNATRAAEPGSRRLQPGATAATDPGYLSPVLRLQFRIRRLPPGVDCAAGGVCEEVLDVLQREVIGCGYLKRAAELAWIRFTRYIFVTATPVLLGIRDENVCWRFLAAIVTPSHCSKMSISVIFTLTQSRNRLLEKQDLQQT